MDGVSLPRGDVGADLGSGDRCHTAATKVWGQMETEPTLQLVE